MTSLADSVAVRLAALDPAATRRVLGALEPRERAALWYRWQFWARPEQLPPPGDWATWLILAGRGFGKTRCGCEFVRAEVESKRAGRVAIVTATAADGRDTIVEGESGLLAISPPWFRPHYEPSKRRVTWPNGAIATLYSAEDPDQLRGPQHDLALADELAAWKRMQETWDQLAMTMRLGVPRVAIATTPRPLGLLRELVRSPDVVVTRGATAANRANLSKRYLQQLRRFEGTAQGRQELEGELLDDRQGAMFSGAWIERCSRPPQLRRVVVGVDPAVSTSRDSDETGIIVAGAGYDERAYVLEDLSAKLTPDGWARRVVEAYDTHEADAVVAETNRGGDMVAAILRAQLRAMGRPEGSVVIETVHASRGKATRAEPVAALYEQRRVFHVGAADRYEKLERQMVEWDPSARVSPDRVDALVWAMTHLALAADPRAAFEGLEESTAVLERAARPEHMGELHDEPDDEDGGWSGIGPLTIG